MMSFLTTVVATYALVVTLAALMQRSLMYHPSQDWAIDPARHAIGVVSYPTADGLTLRSWYAPPKDAAAPVFVHFHGNAGNISDRSETLEYFRSLGYGFLLAEYRGYGGNPGRPNEQGFYNDARAAINWLKEQKIDESRLVIFGESIGCGAAAQMAIEHPQAKALILEAPFTSAVKIAGDVYPWLGPFSHLTLDKYDNIAKAPSFAMPTLVISGDADSVIPYRHSEALIAAVGAQRKKLVTLKGGDHSNLISFGLLKEVHSFIESL